MKLNKFFKLPFLFFQLFAVLFFIVLFFSAPVIAEIATIKVLSVKKIISASGIAISPSGVTQIPETTIKFDSGKTWLVSFNVKGDQNDVLLVSALATTEDGDNIFSPTVSISTVSPSTGKEDKASELECIKTQQLKTQEPTIRQSQLGYLKALIDNRIKQRIFAKANLLRLLDPNAVTVITKLENNLGLYPGYPIIQEENPFLLIIRSFRLVSALKLFELRRQTLKRESAN